MLKKILKALGFLILFLVVIGGTLYMIYLRPFMEKMKVTTLKSYDKNLTIVLGGGGNSGILVSDSLILVIDTKMDDAGKALYEQVKQLAGDKPILVVNTHIHPDHTKGNKFYKDVTIMAGGNYSKEQWIKEDGAESLPNKWLQDTMDVRMGDEIATIYNFGKNIHTNSDIVVYLHKRKMLFTGDIVLNKQAPFILGAADPEGYLAAFDYFTSKFDIQTIVPGHGDIGGVDVIATFKEYFLDMKTAANDSSQKNKLEAKYADWNQIPFMMSTGATIKAFQKKKQHN